MSTLCQAAAMHAASYLGEVKEDLPPCDELGEVSCGSWLICVGCAESLELFSSLVSDPARWRRVRGRS